MKRKNIDALTQNSTLYSLTITDTGSTCQSTGTYAMCKQRTGGHLEDFGLGGVGGGGGGGGGGRHMSIKSFGIKEEQ